MIFTSANKTLTLIFLSQSRFTFLKTKKRMTECHKLLLNAPGGFLHFFLPGALDLQRHFFPSTKTKNNYCHTNTINTLSEKETVQVTSNEQSLVIWRIPLAGRLLFNTSVSPQWYWNETQQITTVWWCQTEKCCVSVKKKENCPFAPMLKIITPPPLSQITEPAVFTLIFYSYTCTDVHFWRGGVPINRWSTTSLIYDGSFLSAVPARAHATRPDLTGEAEGSSGKIVWGGGGRKKITELSFETDTWYCRLFPEVCVVWFIRFGKRERIIKLVAMATDLWQQSRFCVDMSVSWFRVMVSGGTALDFNAFMLLMLWLFDTNNHADET